MPRTKFVPKGRIPNEYGHIVQGRLIRGELFVRLTVHKRKAEATKDKKSLIKQGRPVRIFCSRRGFEVWMSNERIFGYK